MKKLAFFPSTFWIFTSLTYEFEGTLIWTAPSSSEKTIVSPEQGTKWEAFPLKPPVFQLSPHLKSSSCFFLHLHSTAFAVGSDLVIRVIAVPFLMVSPPPFLDKLSTDNVTLCTTRVQQCTQEPNCCL